MYNLLKINNVKSITVDDLSKNHKMEYISKFQNEYKDLSNLTKIDSKVEIKIVRKQELCNEIGISVTTLKKYMKYLGMKIFYRHEYFNIGCFTILELFQCLITFLFLNIN